MTRDRTISLARPDRNTALELVRATEAAAIRALPWVGRGDKSAADRAAVEAMRAYLNTAAIDGTVVIGEGEKDKAPMLYKGERIGRGLGPACDIAVDPIDGTTLTATGRNNAVSVIAAADKGAMLDASSVFYMDKIVTDHHGHGVIDITQSIEDNIRALAAATGKPVDDMAIAVLDRPRHAALVTRIRELGAATRLLSDGDVAGGIIAATPGSRIDMCVGVGGSPEGITTACAVRALGGFMQAVLAPSDDSERETAESAGLDTLRVYGLRDLVATDNTIFVATGVTDGDLVAGAARRGSRVRTESIILRGRSGTLRRVITDHALDKWQ